MLCLYQKKKNKRLNRPTAVVILGFDCIKRISTIQKIVGFRMFSQCIHMLVFVYPIKH